MPYKDKAKQKEFQARYYQAHKEESLAQSRQWKLDNPEAETQHKRTYREKNMGKFAAYAANRRAAKLNRTPAWDLHELTELIYMECPEDKTVDHVIPLQGVNVSGLHVYNNLQYLTPSQNSIKGNRYV